jgi:hypothetical protein
MSNVGTGWGQIPPKNKNRVAIIHQPLVFIGTPGPIRTGDLRIRSPALYPAELRAQNLGEKMG